MNITLTGHIRRGHDGAFLVPYGWMPERKKLREDNARLRRRNMAHVLATIKAEAAKIHFEGENMVLRDELEDALSMKALLAYTLLMTWLGIGCYVIARVW